MTTSMSYRRYLRIEIPHETGTLREMMAIAVLNRAFAGPDGPEVAGD
jgi:hypothetical protein